MKLFLILVSVLWSLPGFGVEETSSKVVGQIGLIGGKVLLDQKLIKKPSPVKEGAVVEVMKDSYATLTLGQGSVFKLAPDSKLIVKQFGIEPQKKEEGGDLDLKYGRIRALILNRGESRNIRIRCRSATMGVRGTEVFIDAPKESKKPIQFFTLEGKAEVMTGPAAKVVPLPQNQGIATHGGEGAAPGNGEPKSGQTLAQVKESIKNSNIGTAEVKPGLGLVPPKGDRALAGNLSDHLGIGPSQGPDFQLDPLLDRFKPLNVNVRFCSATSAVCP